jgi:glutamate-1-semialdehyde 2,1-aminomutase
VTILEAYRSRHQGSARLYEESIKTFPSGVTHDVRYVTPFPLFIDRAEGSRKWDVDDNEYVDFVMGHGALFMGHAHPQISKAVADQAARGTHHGSNHLLELRWGQAVQRLIPSAEAVRFTNSGTEAVQMAIRLARAHTGREKILKFDSHFHGWHDAVMGARPPESDIPQAAGIPAASLANTISIPQNDPHLVEDKLSAGDVAALLVEPTGAAWGTLPLQQGFLANLREITGRHATVLIFDEVVTGFRVAPGGAQERHGVMPDLTTLAKILAGGLPGGAVAGKTDIISMTEFRDNSDWNLGRRVMHPGTFNANPLSAAAGVTMLSLVDDRRRHEHADSLVGRLVPALNDVLERRAVPGCAYGFASYFHIALGKDLPHPRDGVEWPMPDGQLPPRTPGPLVQTLKRAMLNHGVDLMGGTGGFTSGVHTDDDIDRAIDAFDAAIRDMQAESIL